VIWVEGGAMPDSLLVCFNCGSVYDEKLIYPELPFALKLCPTCIEEVTISA
jgi:hypothetical protein